MELKVNLNNKIAHNVNKNALPAHQSYRYTQYNNKIDNNVSFGLAETFGVLTPVINAVVSVLTVFVSEHLLTRRFIRNKAGYLSSLVKHLDEKIKIMNNNPQQARSHLVPEYTKAKNYLLNQYKKYLNPYTFFYRFHGIVPRAKFKISDDKIQLIAQELKGKGFPNAAQSAQDHLKYYDIKEAAAVVQK